MPRIGVAQPLLFAPLLVLLTGCLQQNTQSQGLSANANNDPCAPSTSSSLISTGRGLLEITNSLLATQESINGKSASYNQRVQLAENEQRVQQANNLLNDVERLSGTNPCVASDQ